MPIPINIGVDIVAMSIIVVTFIIDPAPQCNSDKWIGFHKELVASAAGERPFALRPVLPRVGKRLACCP